MKIDLDTVQATLRDQGVPQDKITAILRDLTAAIEEEKADRKSAPKGKTQLVVLLDDPENQFEDKAFLGWVVKMEVDGVPQSAPDRVKAAGLSFNKSRKGRKHPVKSIREVFAGIPRKFFKEEDVTRKTVPQTKEPVLIQPVKGELT